MFIYMFANEIYYAVTYCRSIYIYIAGGPWFDSRSGHDRFCVSVSICLFNFLHRASLNLNQIIRCSALVYLTTRN